MANSLRNRIYDIYKLSDCPVIITDREYNLQGANQSATEYFNIKTIDSISKVAKRIVGNDTNGSFTLDDSSRFFVNTFTQDEESVKVISLDYSSEKSDVKDVFRSSVYEMNYRRSMINLMENIEQLQNIKDKEIVDKTEKELYNLFSLLQMIIDRHKCETGLRSYFKAYYDIVRALDSVLSQADMVMKVLGMNVIYELNGITNMIVLGDKEGFALSVIKLLRGMCCFAQDKTVKVILKEDGEKLRILFEVKSDEIIKWLEKSIETEDFMSVIKKPKALQDAFFITDALKEFKYDGLDAKCEQVGENTQICVSMTGERVYSQMLNANPLLYIGDPFSTLTIFFTPLEK